MLNIPTNPKSLEDRSKTDLVAELPSTANPFLQESWMAAQAIANARRVYEFYQQLTILEQEAIPITAQEKVQQWASYWGLTLNPATQSAGNVIATGTAGTLIDTTAQLQASNGIQYGITAAATISNQSAGISSLTHVGLVATAVLTSNISMYTGMTMTISGAVQSSYNGDFTITVLSNNSFTYTMASNPGANATGTLLAAFTTAVLQVQSIQFEGDAGAGEVNQDANAKLTIVSPIVGVNNNFYVDQGGLGGGVIQETISQLKTRLINRVQNPVAMFNDAAIRANIIDNIPGVTGVFIQDATPAAGQVTIYFVRANDASPIPSGADVTAVYNQTLKIKPANTLSSDVIVSAPTPVATTFNFTAMTPNDAGTQAAVTAALDALFRDEGAVGSPMTKVQYNAAIANAGVTAFTLSSPTGDIGGGASQYPTLSGVNYP